MVDDIIILINVHELLKEDLNDCLTLTLENDLDVKYFKNANPSIDHDQYYMYKCERAVVNTAVGFDSHDHCDLGGLICYLLLIGKSCDWSLTGDLIKLFGTFTIKK